MAYLCMPLDHYVSQVHLKNFYSPVLGEQLHAIRKSNLKYFPPRAQDVCRIEDGSTNAYLKNDRAIEDFLKGVEPKYNSAIAKLREDKIDKDCIYAIAGFAAFVSCCTLAAMRIHSEPLRRVVEDVGMKLDEQGKIPPAPEALGGKQLKELLDEGVVKIEIDPKYPQALGIANVVERTSLFGNSRWEVLINEDSSSPFFTSDHPIPVEPSVDPFVHNRVMPLAPDLAVRIVPNTEMQGQKPDFEFSKFSSVRRKLSGHRILDVNRLIVRSAEDCVFYKDQHDWIPGFVKKNRYYRLETTTRDAPNGKSGFWFSQQIVLREPKEGAAT